MKPKKLNLQEITKIYQLLKPAIDGGERDEIFLDEIDKIIELVSPEALLECLYVIYDNKVRFSNVIEFQTLLALGLDKNDFYYFVEFMRGLNGSSKR